MGTSLFSFPSTLNARREGTFRINSLVGGGEERVPLGVEAGAVAGEETEEGLANPEDGKDGEGESGPVNKGRRALVVEDSEEGPGNGNAAGKVALRGREGVGRGSRLEREEGKEDKDFGEDAGGVVLSIDAERLKGSQEDEVGREAVPEREREMDPQFVVDILREMVLLDNVEDVRDGGGDKEGKEESDDVVAASPDVDIDDVEDDEEGEAPVDAVDDDLLAVVEELVDNRAEEQEVDHRPQSKDPTGGREVRLLARSIGTGGSSDSVDVGTEEQDVENHVHHLEQDTISPISH